MDRDTGRPQWVVEVLAQDNERGEVIRVTVTGDQPKVNPGSARSASTAWRRSPGTTTARHGVAYRAAAIHPAQPARAA